MIQAIEDDRKKGFFPFFYSSILGSTSTCAFDDVEEIGPVSHVNDLWLHVDGAYAGNSFCCPELRYLKYGLSAILSFYIMAPIARGLTDAQIKAVAAYVSYLE